MLLKSVLIPKLELVRQSASLPNLISKNFSNQKGNEKSYYPQQVVFRNGLQ